MTLFQREKYRNAARPWLVLRKVTSIEFFFLKHAKELHIIVLRRKRDAYRTPHTQNKY
jgi:hypothetical protein